jgi:hypothetical protein
MNNVNKTYSMFICDHSICLYPTALLTIKDLEWLTPRYIEGYKSYGFYADEMISKLLEKEDGEVIRFEFSLNSITLSNGYTIDKIYSDYYCSMSEFINDL